MKLTTDIPFFFLFHHDVIVSSVLHFFQFHYTLRNFVFGVIRKVEISYYYKGKLLIFTKQKTKKNLWARA